MNCSWVCLELFLISYFVIGKFAVDVFFIVFCIPNWHRELVAYNCNPLEDWFWHFLFRDVLDEDSEYCQELRLINHHQRGSPGCGFTCEWPKLLAQLSQSEQQSLLCIWMSWYGTLWTWSPAQLQGRRQRARGQGSPIQEYLVQNGVNESKPSCAGVRCETTAVIAINVRGENESILTWLLPE